MDRIGGIGVGIAVGWNIAILGPIATRLAHAYNVSLTTIVRDAWTRGRKLAVHGWIYGLRDGRLRDTGMCVTAEAELPACYAAACAGVVADAVAVRDGR